MQLQDISLNLFKTQTLTAFTANITTNLIKKIGLNTAEDYTNNWILIPKSLKRQKEYTKLKK